jgi:hypothetical protein
MDISGWYREQLLPFIDRNYINIIWVESIALLVTFMVIWYRRTRFNLELRRFLKYNEQVVHSTDWSRYPRLSRRVPRRWRSE